MAPTTATSTELLTIRQLAEYLMVSEKTVYRMLERNRLPAIRVGALWRFRRQDIDAWLTEEVRRVEHEGQRGLLDSLGAAELAIAPLLEPANVWRAVRAGSRDELLSDMLSKAVLEPDVDRGQLLASILEREGLCSTAMLDRVAFPHPVDPRPFRFVRKRLLLAVLAEPIDWRDPHGHHPRVVALVLARSTQGHLLTLSRALKLLGDGALVDQLLAARSVTGIIDRIGRAESQLATPPSPQEETA